jgi:hypothetical protein
LLFFVGIIKSETCKGVTKSIEDKIASLHLLIDTSKSEKTSASSSVEEGTGSTSNYDIPSGITIPSENPVCGCEEHLDRKEFEYNLNIPAKRLFEMLFVNCPENHALYNLFTTKRGEFAWMSEDWSDSVPQKALVNGEPSGSIGYKYAKWMMPINVPMRMYPPL